VWTWRLEVTTTANETLLKGRKGGGDNRRKNKIGRKRVFGVSRLNNITGKKATL